MHTTTYYQQERLTLKIINTQKPKSTQYTLQRKKTDNTPQMVVYHVPGGNITMLLKIPNHH